MSFSDDRSQMTDDRCRIKDDRKQTTDDRLQKKDYRKKKVRKFEGGMLSIDLIPLCSFLASQPLII
jgi:hypothetical protein